MTRPRTASRRIALFVEGDTECGDSRQKTLPVFFHKWLDPQLTGSVGIQAVKFQGVSEYLDDLPTKVGLYLDRRRVNYVVGLVDLYGLPPSRIDLSGCATIKEKVAKARREIRKLIPREFNDRFRQHFAVHEVEAWLLAYPERWPPKVRDKIKRRPPEQVNFNEPPAKFLKRILDGRYKKTVRAKNIFPQVDPQTAIDKCPFLKLLADDLLEIARRLQ
ncbi:MAG: DUF4276 family protein [Planctomycetes bacterium]|nr:DUF4276 family protein [Planctomycetota bacterium]